MNKTVSINLGGLFFHIDEDAYQKLNHYFDAIRKSLLPEGKDEIMNDIESRIGELLTEKLKNEKQVVGTKEVEEVIEIMGQPEDYRLDDDGTAQKNTSTDYSAPYYGAKRTRKFYRDNEKNIIGGVCAGIAHYFRIDPLWIRILFIISPFLSFGSSIIIYVLLWILIPEAVTTTEKLEMTGEAINISNIERKVREEFDALGKKIQSVDYDKIGANAKSGAEKLGNGFEKVFVAIFKAISKVIGAGITVFSALSLVGLLIFFFTILFTSSAKVTVLYPFIVSLNYTNIPIWVTSMLLFLAIAIPLFSLFLLGLKILTENLRSIGNTAKYTLLALWIVALGGLVYIGVMERHEINAEGKTVMKKEINITENDTLNLKFRYNTYFDKSFENGSSFRIEQDSAGNNIIYSNDVTLFLMKSDEPKAYLQIEKISLGSSMSEARKRAELIAYNFENEENTLILDNYLTTDRENKYRNQKVELFLYLPVGTHFLPDSSVKHYDETDNSFFDLWYDSENMYRMDKNDVKCITCDHYIEEQEAQREMEEEERALEHAHADDDAVTKGYLHINDEDIDVTIKNEQ
ncbi:PspC domain-containing protein [Flavobacterium litorale]|uniref:PspC domain-containing protein n=1 Tax=Flavobacterium litorale TaxID=2856519 RepID=A0ABX8V6C5_9FLAO|nr:PspC domain-containing protein [Flavobacterium litorale]QYJ68386.1 PspC domain-containing protein [Flavobacterium litorale]